MLVRPGGSFFQSNVPPKPPARSGWLPATQLHSSRLCTDISTITSPERLASKNQSRGRRIVGQIGRSRPRGLDHDHFTHHALVDLVDGPAQPDMLRICCPIWNTRPLACTASTSRWIDSALMPAGFSQ